MSLAPRAVIVTVLAGVTTWLPLSGAMTPAAEPTPVYGTESALDVLTATSLTGTDDFDAGDALMADPAAAARAAVTASRSSGRGTLPCGDEANGSWAAGTPVDSPDVLQPLQPGTYRLTSPYGPRWGGKHEGMDWAAPPGTPIYAIADGVVEYVGFGLAGRSGMIMVVRHEIDGVTYRTWYIHSYPDGVFVREGQQVKAGDVIGEVGSYGNSTGPHVHLEVHTDDAFTTTDPAAWLEEMGAVPPTPDLIACAARGPGG